MVNRKSHHEECNRCCRNQKLTNGTRPTPARTAKKALSGTVKKFHGSLLRALLLPSLLIGQTSRVAYSHARMTPRLSGVLTMLPGRGTSEEFIRRGHSHNDYHQENPLSSALLHGLNSVEVDVFPRKDQLWVAHTIFELDSSRTIENLYIAPILTMLQRSGMATCDPRVTVERDTRPFPQSRLSQRKRMKSSPNSNADAQSRNPLMHYEGDALTLMVDFKSDPEKSIRLLLEAIAPLRPYLSKVDKNGKLHKGRVTVLVSGNRPKTESLQSSEEKGDRFIFIDGRSHDIDSQSDTTLVPMVSLPWRNLQLARIVGRRDKYMRNMAEKAHQQGKQLRIWGAPNNEFLWRQMVRNGVDLLSIDDHGKFARFASQVGFLR